MKSEIKVKELVSFSKAQIKYKRNKAGGLGGFFLQGMRWEDYLKNSSPEEEKYLNAFRKYIIDNKIKIAGDTYQNGKYTPLFNDKTVSLYSFRAWGDLMAAIWSTEEDKDYCYMDFYVTITLNN